MFELISVLQSLILSAIAILFVVYKKKIDKSNLKVCLFVLAVFIISFLYTANLAFVATDVGQIYMLVLYIIGLIITLVSTYIVIKEYKGRKNE